MGTWFGKTALICGQIFPLKLLLSTVLRTTGRAEHPCRFRERDGVVDDRLAVEIGNAKEHLRLMVDQRDHAIVRGQQSFLAAFHRHERLLFLSELNLIVETDDVFASVVPVAKLATSP